MYVLNKEAINIFFKTKKMRVAKEVYDKVNEDVLKILEEAYIRAQKNKRTTVMFQDI